MKTLLLLAGILFVFIAPAQVGIGTNTPNTNSALDITSSTKGVLLPRINDTSNVTNPSEGLLIYDKQALTPAFHDGTKWNTLAARINSAPTAGDSITYTITNPGTGYVAGVFSTINSLSQYTHTTYNFPVGGGGGGSANSFFENLYMNKELDENSIQFFKSLSSGYYTNSMVIEFKIYTPGAATPNFSIKLTTPYITAGSIKLSAGGSITEDFQINAFIYGFKNWNTGASFGWSIASKTYTAY